MDKTQYWLGLLEAIIKIWIPISGFLIGIYKSYQAYLKYKLDALKIQTLAGEIGGELAKRLDEVEDDIKDLSNRTDRGEEQINENKFNIKMISEGTALLRGELHTNLLQQLEAAQRGNKTIQS